MQFVFYITLAFAIWGATHFFTSGVKDEWSKRFDKPKVTVLSHSMRFSESEVAVIGEIRNDGPASEASFTVAAKFFDKKNNLTDVGDEYVVGGFAAGSTQTFKIKLGGCNANKKFNPANYDHYDIEVH